MAAPLPVGKVLIGAFLVPWWNRKAFLRALAIPVMLLVAYSLSWYYAGSHIPAWVNWALCFGYAALFSLFAVMCHRLVLLDATRVARNAEPSWSRRESLFFGWVVGAWIAYMLTGLAIVMVVGTVMLNVGGESWLRPIEYAAKTGGTYVFARVSFVFPATAIDRRLDFRGAWEMTTGNGWRLLIVVGALPWVLTYLVGLAYRSNPTPLEILLLATVGTALFAVEIAALSIAYRELAKQA